LVPAKQRYGITLWSPMDSADNSSWRAGEPIGLWKRDYTRKLSYGGFANGLAGRDVSADFTK
ncbi:MAG: glycoside hydrolase, partial [Cytophagaceae bacterium]